MTIESDPAGPLRNTNVTGERFVGQDDNGDAIYEAFEVRLSADGETFVARAGAAEIILDQRAVWELLEAVPLSPQACPGRPI